MSMRTDYQRSAGFGAMRASIKAGKGYEAKVVKELRSLYPDKEKLGFRLKEQYPRNGGYVDVAFTYFDIPLLLIEIKSQWSSDAYKQLLRYRGDDTPSLSLICICKTYHPHIPLPEEPICLQLDQLLHAERGRLTIIPWSGRRKW